MQVTASLLAQVICNVKINAHQIDQALVFDLGDRYRKMSFPLPGLVVTQIAPIYAAIGIMKSRFKGIEIQGDVDPMKDDPYGIVLNTGFGEYLFVTMHVFINGSSPTAREISFYVHGPRQVISDQFERMTEEVKEVIAYVHKHFKQYIL